LLLARFIAKDDMGADLACASAAHGADAVHQPSERDAASVVADISAQMHPDNDLALFADGTKSSGGQVAPFKPS
jgi:hypothetical protein